MKLPGCIGVMVLPGATLFPNAMLPLHIFEPRYRQMLADALGTHRFFAVAMRKPKQSRDIPSHIAGVGIIRASVHNRDGTSQLMLHGFARVELASATQYKPYRMHSIRELPVPKTVEDPEMSALASHTRALIAQYFGEVTSSLPIYANQDTSKVASSLTDYINRLKDPSALADFVASSLLRNPLQRQALLETLDTKTRLKRLLHFLLEQISPKRKDGGHE